MKMQEEVFGVKRQIKTIERLIGCGQVEELVQQAKDELSLIEDYYRNCLYLLVMCVEYRIWEGPKVESPQAYSK